MARDKTHPDQATFRLAAKARKDARAFVAREALRGPLWAELATACQELFRPKHHSARV